MDNAQQQPLEADASGILDALIIETPPHTGRHINEKVDIYLDPSAMDKVVNKGRTILTQRKEIYSFAGQVARVLETADEQTGEESFSIDLVSGPAMQHIANGELQFFSVNEKGDKLPKSCSPNVASLLLANKGQHLAPLAGITRRAFLRSDGSIATEDGYDERSHLFLSNLPDMEPIPEVVSKEQARAALEHLLKPVSEFPLGDDISSVNLACAIFASVLRPSLPTCPFFVINAPQYESGKTLLTSSILGLQRGATEGAIALDRGGIEELEKKLSGALLAGAECIWIDNLNASLNSSLMAMMATSQYPTIRQFGKLTNLAVRNNAFVIINGNGAVLQNDLARRNLAINLDPHTPAPGLRSGFKTDPLGEYRDNRGAYIRDVLMIVRAYQRSGETVQTAPFGSFPEFKRLVVEPLVWLGMDDPIMNLIEGLMEAVPWHSAAEEMFESWHRQFADKQITAADLHAWLKANGISDLYTDTMNALTAKMELDHTVDLPNKQALGTHLSQMHGLYIGEYRFERIRPKSKSIATKFRVTRTTK